MYMTLAELAAGMAAVGRVLLSNTNASSEFPALGGSLLARARQVANLGKSTLPDPSAGVAPTVRVAVVELHKHQCCMKGMPWTPIVAQLVEWVEQSP